MPEAESTELVLLLRYDLLLHSLGLVAVVLLNLRNGTGRRMTSHWHRARDIVTHHAAAKGGRHSCWRQAKQLLQCALE